jgi:signal transduction histidine kinase
MKMDLSQLAKKFDFSAPDIQVRWQRIQTALSAGVELKRRVIEELRPTLLDNLGLVAAIRWQCEETCAQANLVLEADFPEEELKVDLNIAIAIFRVAQETMTNIVKHARATTVKVSLKGTNQELVLTIEDDGVGFENTTRRASGSHGLLSMKYRMQTIGGTFQIISVFPHGTRVIVWLGTDLANQLATLE